MWPLWPRHQQLQKTPVKKETEATGCRIKESTRAKLVARKATQHRNATRVQIGQTDHSGGKLKTTPPNNIPITPQPQGQYIEENLQTAQAQYHNQTTSRKGYQPLVQMTAQP